METTNRKQKWASFGRSLLSSLVPVIAAFIIGGIIISLLGENPFTTYWILISKSLFTVKGFAYTLHKAAPLILTGLAIAVTFKANIFNMGVEGQLLIGGFFAGIAGASLTGTSPAVTKIICMAVGMGCGVLFALIPAVLKAYFRVNEMVVTLMLNYAMIKILEFLATGVFRDNGSGYVATPTIQAGAMFRRLGGSKLTPFFFISLIVFLIMYFVMNRSVLGYEIRAIGLNPVFAEAASMKVRNKIIEIMVISGALSGLAGAGQMMSDQFKYTLTFSGTPGLGWDGMLVSLLGKHDPVGILIAAIFYSALKTGSDKINFYTNVPKEIIAVIQSLIILFLAVQFFDEKTNLFDSLKKKITGRDETTVKEEL